MASSWTAALICLVCSAGVAAAPVPPVQDLAIEHVTVLSMTAEGAPLADATVVIRGGRIASITASGEKPATKGTKRIDGRGKWLMPGLTDMHMHLENDRLARLFLRRPDLPDGTVNTEDVLTPYLVNGVTQVVNLTGMSESVGQRLDVETGRILGPHIMNGAMIDGDPSIWPLGMTRSAGTPEAGRQAVRDVVAEGYQLVKVYSRLNLETFTAIVDEARKRKLRVVGHIPQRNQGTTDKFFQPGFDLVAHSEEFAQQTNPPALDAIPRYVEMAKRNGTWLTATLSLNERLVEETRSPDSLKSRPEMRYLLPGIYDTTMNHNPYVAEAGSPGRLEYLQRVVDFNRQLVPAFAAAGIPVLAGTDAPVPGVVPGFAIHDELEAMARAGLTNKQVLEGATRLPSEWLGVIADRGTVEENKRADLLLLDADPLVDVANTRRISAIILGGRHLTRAALDQRLKELDARYSNSRRY